MSTNKEILNGWKRTLIILIPFAIVVGIFQLVAYLITGVSIVSANAPRETYQELIISLFGFMGTVLTVWFFVWKFDNERLWDIGLRIKNRGRDIVYGFAFGLLIMLLGFTILIYLKEISVTAINFKASDFIYSILLFVLVAFQEEIFIRGYILNNLMKSMNRYVALIISALFFSVLHIPNPDSTWLSFINITLAGLLLGLSYIYTRNLWFPIALHFSWNFFQGPIFGFGVSGQNFYTLVVQHRTSDTLLNGGSFGFEGSLLSVGFQLVCLWVIWRIFRKEQIPVRTAG